MHEKVRKQIVNAKVKSVAVYGLQMMIGQSQAVMHKAEVILMRINRQMTSNPLGLISRNAICNYLKIDTPRQDIIKSNFTLIHKFLKRKQPEQILNKLQIPKRSSGKIYVKGKNKSERTRRSPLDAGIQLYNALPQNVKVLPCKVLKKKLKNLDIKYSPFK